MKNIILVILLLSYSANAQTLKVFDLNNGNFPTIKAKFFAFDSKGEQILNLATSDFKIFENGTERRVLSVSCPQPPKPDVMSSVLTIDRSGSTTGTVLKIAKAASDVWIDNALVDSSECAITAFNSSNYLVHDFSMDKKNLKNSFNYLNSDGGTDFNAALINPLAGSLKIAERGKYKKVVILITDGLASGNQVEIISRAISIQAIVYCLIVQRECPNVLRNICTATGGSYFEYINNEQDAIAACKQILKINQGTAKPCEIEWESAPDCEIERNVELLIPAYSLNSKFKYNSPANSQIILKINPYGIALGFIEPGKTKDTTVRIEAVNHSVKILNITSSNPLFSIIDYGGSAPPFILNTGEIRNLKIRYSPTDSSSSFARIEIEKEVCSKEIIYFSSLNKYKKESKNLKVTHPNGGEKFAVGTDTIITWEGVLPDDIVCLEYSTDDGKTWIRIADTASGLKYYWTVPNTPSDSCLMKVKQLKNPYCKRDSEILGMGTLKSLDISPDDKKLCSSGGRSVIYIWDIQTGSVIDSISIVGGAIQSVFWSPDGSKILSGSSDKNIKIWDANTGSLIFTLSGHTSQVHEAKWSSDGSKIASASVDNNIKLWDAVSGNILKTLIGHTRNVTSIAWSTDGSKIVSSSRDSTIKIWDVASGNAIKTLYGHTFWVTSINLSPDGTKIASGSQDNTAKIWDATTGGLIRTLTGHSNFIYSVAWSPDGSKIISGGKDNTIIIWNTSTGSIIKRIDYPFSEIYSLLWSSDGSNIICGGIDGITIWDAISYNLIKTIPGHTGGIHSISLSPDGRKVVSGHMDYKVRLWDVNTAGYLLTNLGHTEWVHSVAWSSDGTRIASSCRDSTIKIWDANSGNLMKTISGFDDQINCICWSPDNSKIVGGSLNSTCRIWDANTGSFICTLVGHSASIQSVDWSQDGTKILSGSNDNSVKIWNANTGSLIHTLYDLNNLVCSVCWSNDGGKIAAGTYDKFMIWDANSYNLLNTVSNHINEVFALKWSHDGTKLASGGRDSYTNIWNTNADSLLETFDGPTASVYSLAWSLDDSKIICGCWDGTIRVCDLEEVLQEDISDSLWAIISPNLTSIGIDMGQHCANAQEPKDKIITDFITNNSQFDIRIDSITISGRDALDFEVYYMNMPMILHPAEKTMAKFRFHPKTLGLKLADINIYYQAGVQRQTIRGEAIDCNIDILSNIINMGQVCINTLKDTLAAVLFNHSAVDILIDSTVNIGPDVTQFKIIEGSNSFILKSGIQHISKIVFTPLYKGIACCRIAFYHNGLSSPEIVQVYGEGIDCGIQSFYNIKLKAGDIIANAGEEIKIPLYLTAPAKGLSYISSGIITELSFNANILYPNQSEQIILNEIKEDSTGKFTRILKMYLPEKIFSGEPFYFNMVTALGYTDSTGLILNHDSTFIVGLDTSFYNIDILSGSLKLNICHEGGDRLLNTESGNIQLFQVVPNPVNETAVLEFELIEDGITKIFIVNPLGEKVKIISNGKPKLGRQKVTVNIKEMPTGTYFIVLQTPTETRTQQLMIVR